MNAAAQAPLPAAPWHDPGRAAGAAQGTPGALCVPLRGLVRSEAVGLGAVQRRIATLPAA